MLPTEVHADVKRMGLLYSPYQDIVRYLQIGQHRWLDARVARAHVQRRFESLPGTKKHVHALNVKDPEPQPDAESTSGSTTSPSTASAATDPIVEKLNLVCAALEKLGEQTWP